MTPQCTRRHQDFRRHLVGPQKAKAVLLEDPGNTREQMVIAAPEQGGNAREQAQCRPIRPQLLERRPHQRPDEDDVTTALGARQAAKAAELAEPSKVMRIAREMI